MAQRVVGALGVALAENKIADVEAQIHNALAEWHNARQVAGDVKPGEQVR